MRAEHFHSNYAPKEDDAPDDMNTLLSIFNWTVLNRQILLRTFWDSPSDQRWPLPISDRLLKVVRRVTLQPRPFRHRRRRLA